MTDDPYQSTAPIKAQEIAANQVQTDATPAQLHAQAKAKSVKTSVLANAVSHLNQQAERGEHAPRINYDPAESTAP